ncbi:hypothetical protein N7365_23120 [Pseudomonas sediminis]|uniref:hypothetical protein n=1 Tax=Pseudomonas sediminis TaxID=1691904 RepID=UPI0024481F3D|nr:hypothetical protein [Pseudomonas sediminis]MDG9760983.1 hypothetical protein [Pseudomonas sediminis]
MADRDFENIGFKDIFIKSISAIKWFAKIGKHLGSVTVKKFEDVTFSSDNSLVGIRNGSGEILYVPKDILDVYVSTSPKLLEQIAINIEEGRELKIGSNSNGIVDEVTVGIKDKWIFCKSPEDLEDGVTLPELLHGDDVILEGEVTRENKTTNSMGFKYKGHILTSYPQVGSIVPYKETLFLKCRIYAVVSRMDENGFITAKRPKLYFSSIEPLEEFSTRDLFS